MKIVVFALVMVVSIGVLIGFRRTVITSYSIHYTKLYDPVHLLTKEAFELYLTHLELRAGVLALHVSNRYLDLTPVVAALAQHFRLALVVIDGSDAQSEWPSEWLLLARNAGTLPPGAPGPASVHRALWTDDP